MDSLLLMIALILYMLITANFIGDAAKRFKKEEYFMFGLNVVLSLYNIIVFTYLIFEGKII